jgi:serine/threonine protein kinase
MTVPNAKQTLEGHMPKYAPLEPGDPTVLQSPSGGSYDVLGRLGAGGQGAVYMGRTPDGEHVAIKLLHSQMNADPQARARFVREVAAAKKVEPFCTARVIEAEVDGDRPYVVSEYIDGPSLHELVAQQGPRPQVELDRLAMGMVVALTAIHEVGIVHRDFKPNNVLLAKDGPRVVDFGIARTVNSQESAVTATGMVVGTPGYLAPEQLTGAPLQPAVDIFAFGATMVFAATGQSPFEADSLPVIINRILNDDPDLSVLGQPLRDIIGRCLAKDAAARPTAPQLLAEMLGNAGVALSSARPAQDDLLEQGTRIAAQLPSPPPVQPRTPTPAPFASPQQPSPQQPYGQPAYGQLPYGQQQPPAYNQQPAPPSYNPQQNRQGPQTPPPAHMGGAPTYQPPQQTPPPFQQTPPPFQQTPPPFQQTPPPFQGGTPPPFHGGGTPPPFQGGGTPPPFQGGPGTAPAFPYPQAAPKRSNGPAIAAIGCAVVVVLALLLVVVLVVANNDDSETATIKPGGTFSEEYAGTWTGNVSQRKPSSASYKVTITIVNGEGTGKIKYESAPGDPNGTWSCSGTITYLRHTPDASYKTVTREQITDKENATCDDVTYVVLFPASSGDKPMYITTFSDETTANLDKSGTYNAIGTLKK